MQTTGPLDGRAARDGGATRVGRAVLARYPALTGDPAIRAALAYAACSLFCVGVLLVSSEPVHRLWGGCAAAGYGCAAVASLASAAWVAARPPQTEQARRTAAGRLLDLALVLALAGAVAGPLCWLAATGRAMPEVWVVVHSADLLVRDGRPYRSAASIGANVYGYNPYLLIMGVMFATGDRRAVIRFAGSAAAVLALVAGPFLLIQPADFIANTVKFPLGLTRATSPAASPLPGHLMAAAGPAGRLAAISLLAASLILLGAMLVVRPPRTAVAATVYLVLALTALFTFAPASRWGYFTYPACLGCWLWLSGLTRPPVMPP